MVEDNRPSTILGSLNEDVFRRILNELTVQDMSAFSTTCRWIREACMPLLFRCTYIRISIPEQFLRQELFLSTSVRPHIRSLVINEECIDQWSPEATLLTDNFLLCGAYPGAAVAERLRELPQLYFLKIYKQHDQTHGLSWSTLRAVLSVPQLREFELYSLHFCPVLRPDDELNVDMLAPLTHFRYHMYVTRDVLAYPSETVALAAVLTKLSATLETLIIGSEVVPMSVLAQSHWPRLRKLTFRGSPWADLPEPLVSICSGMPSLRSLTLKLNPTHRAMVHALWPRDFTSCFPWPSLEQLTVSYPDPTDVIYDHLPPSLRSMSLRCWNHIFVQRRFAGLRRTYTSRYESVLGASDALAILRRNVTPDLVHLELEYRVDEDEDALLQHIAAAYPRLTSLKFSRYQLGPSEQSIVHIAQMLAGLKRLHRLKVYLDLVGPSADELQDTALTFAHALPSLREILLWNNKPILYTFCVVDGCMHMEQCISRGLN